MDLKEPEIERKFLIKEMPDLSKLEKIHYDRYFLFHEEGIEIRIQSKGSIFQFERKVEVSNLTREVQKFDITEAEFEALKSLAMISISRDSYELSKDPEISIKIYQGNFAGLARAEVEFSSEAEARAFQPLSWFGPEITGTDLERDARLIELTKDQFNQLLKKYKV